MPGGVPEFDGIILAGASSKRFSGRDKALVKFAGRTFLDRALDAMADAQNVVVVGPERAGFHPSAWIDEDPQDGGPVAALAAGLNASHHEVVVVLAVDMPLVTRAHISRLVERLDEGTSEGVTLADTSGHVSFLAGAYRRASLERRFTALPEPAGARLRDAMRGMNIGALVSGAAVDCDSPEELQRLETESSG